MKHAIECRCALLTPPGAGAIAVIRLSGHDAETVLRGCFQHSKSQLDSFIENKLYYGHIVDNAERLDDVIVAIERSNGEAHIDICAHGGVRVVERILEQLVRLGATLVTEKAETRNDWPARDEIEREVTRELIHAKTQRAIQFLCRQRRLLPTWIASLATQLETDSAQAKAAIELRLSKYQTAHWLLRGATIALIGPPNAGKSTLLNRLVGRTVAIVSPQPGTTRDYVSEAIELNGIPLTLIDTAGVRTASDELEQAAIHTGRQTAQTTDVQILVLDAADGTVSSPVELIQQNRPMIVALNKCDLPSTHIHPKTKRLNEHLGPVPTVRVSALTGNGLDDLARAIESLLGFSDFDEHEPCIFTNRQRAKLQSLLSGDPSNPTHFRQVLRELLTGTHREPIGRI